MYMTAILADKTKETKIRYFVQVNQHGGNDDTNTPKYCTKNVRVKDLPDVNQLPPY